MGITEPRQEGPGYQYELLTWDIASGRRCSSTKSPFTTVSSQSSIGSTTSNSCNQGFDDMGKSWAIETFAVLPTKLSFAAMSKKMIRWGSYDPPEYTVTSRRLAENLLDILVPDEEEHVVLLARPSGGGYIRAFRVSKNKIGNLESLGKGISIRTNHYNRNKDCCCLSKKDGKLVMMLVNIDNNGGTLYERCLEW